MIAYAGVKWKIRERTDLDKAGFILRYTVANLLTRVDLGGRALEAIDRVELRDRNGIADPIKELLV